MRDHFSVPSSYGTKGAPAAIEEAYRLIISGEFSFFIRSDIVGFFTRIPRARPLGTIAESISDQAFLSLLREATNSELENLEAIGEDADLFPDEEYGVAQGCALSSLLGDILLAKFDHEMNARGVRCLRYVDDFLILGPNEKYTKKAFANAQVLLNEFGLRAYDPFTDSEKADFGRAQHGFEFLGCEIRPGIVRPTKKKKQRLLEDLEELFDDSYAAMANPPALPRFGGALVPTLAIVNRKLQAWGNQYQFCADRGGFEVLDEKVDAMLSKYLGRYSERRKL